MSLGVHSCNPSTVCHLEEGKGFGDAFGLTAGEGIIMGAGAGLMGYEVPTTSFVQAGSW